MFIKTRFEKRSKVVRRDNKFYAEFLTINVKRLIEFLAKFDEL